MTHLSGSLASLAEMFAHAFVLRALAVGMMVSLCASCIGVVLVCKRYSMIGHGLADVGFASLSLALALGVAPLYIATPVLVAASFVIMAVSQRRGVSGDLAIGIVSTGALATGIIITALSNGFNIDVYNYMFGSILAVDTSDVATSAVVTVLVMDSFALFYNRLFLVACDEDFARASGIDVARWHFLISLQTALTIAIGMRMMGTLLISSLIIFPAVTARRLTRSFRGMVAVACVVSVVCFVAGMAASFALNLPTGASVVATNIVAMTLAYLVRGKS